MENDNYISCDEICKQLGGKNEICEVEWNGIKIAIRRLISIKEMTEITDSVVASCISPSGDFVPEILPVVFMSNIIIRYSNIQMPDDVEKQGKLVYGSDLYKFICEHICIEQVNDIRNSIGMIVEMK